jgi:hypothetical protein
VQSFSRAFESNNYNSLSSKSSSVLLPHTLFHMLVRILFTLLFARRGDSR